MPLPTIAEFKEVNLQELADRLRALRIDFPEVTDEEFHAGILEASRTSGFLNSDRHQRWYDQEWSRKYFPFCYTANIKKFMDDSKTGLDQPKSEEPKLGKARTGRVSLTPPPDPGLVCYDIRHGLEGHRYLGNECPVCEKEKQAAAQEPRNQWRCKYCSRMNLAKDKVCAKCKTRRGQKAPDLGPPLHEVPRLPASGGDELDDHRGLGEPSEEKAPHGFPSPPPPGVPAPGPESDGLGDRKKDPPLDGLKDVKTGPLPKSFREQAWKHKGKIALATLALITIVGCLCACLPKAADDSQPEEAEDGDEAGSDGSADSKPAVDVELGNA